MHNGMQYHPIQGQGHKPLKVGNPAVVNCCLAHHLQWELATDHGFPNYYTISKFDRAGFLIIFRVRIKCRQQTSCYTCCRVWAKRDCSDFYFINILILSFLKITFSRLT